MWGVGMERERDNVGESQPATQPTVAISNSLNVNKDFRM